MDKARLQYLMTEYRSLGNLESRIATLRETLERITARLDGMPHGSDGSDKMATITAEIVDLEDELIERTVRLEAGRQEAEAAIDKLEDDRYRLVLRFRYIEALTWKEVAKKMHYDKRNCTRLRNAALRRLK